MVCLLSHDISDLMCSPISSAEHIQMRCLFFCLCFLQAEDSLEAEADALYDDVLTGSVDSETALGKQESKEEVKTVVESGGGKRFSVYIGNFNWVSFDVKPLLGSHFL